MYLNQFWSDFRTFYRLLTPCSRTIWSKSRHFIYFNLLLFVLPKTQKSHFFHFSEIKHWKFTVFTLPTSKYIIISSIFAKKFVSRMDTHVDIPIWREMTSHALENKNFTLSTRFGLLRNTQKYRITFVLYLLNFFFSYRQTFFFSVGYFHEHSVFFIFLRQVAEFTKSHWLAQFWSVFQTFYLLLKLFIFPKKWLDTFFILSKFHLSENFEFWKSEKFNTIKNDKKVTEMKS